MGRHPNVPVKSALCNEEPRKGRSQTMDYREKYSLAMKDEY